MQLCILQTELFPLAAFRSGASRIAFGPTAQVPVGSCRRKRICELSKKYDLSKSIAPLVLRLNWHFYGARSMVSQGQCGNRKCYPVSAKGGKNGSFVMAAALPPQSYRMEICYETNSINGSGGDRATGWVSARRSPGNGGGAPRESAEERGAKGCSAEGSCAAEATAA